MLTVLLFLFLLLVLMVVVLVIVCYTISGPSTAASIRRCVAGWVGVVVFGGGVVDDGRGGDGDNV